MEISRGRELEVEKAGILSELPLTRSSYTMLGFFLTTILLLAYVWWPLAREYLDQFDSSRPLWAQIDWLLIAIFLLMSLLIMVGADLRKDAWILMIGLAGGLVIETWGTQTELWRYYTLERPPLWIIPAWPIASLAIDRIVRMLDRAFSGKLEGRATLFAYWIIFPSFLALMIHFVWPTIDMFLTLAASILCFILVLRPGDHRLALLTFAAGSGLGFFLEYWGTTRECWIYYSGQTPPLFAVMAHGMAAVAFWRTGRLLRTIVVKNQGRIIRDLDPFLPGLNEEAG